MTENNFNTYLKRNKNKKYAVLESKTTMLLHKPEIVPYFLSVYLNKKYALLEGKTTMLLHNPEIVPYFL